MQHRNPALESCLYVPPPPPQLQLGDIFFSLPVFFWLHCAVWVNCCAALMDGEQTGLLLLSAIPLKGTLRCWTEGVVGRSCSVNCWFVCLSLWCTYICLFFRVLTLACENWLHFFFKEKVQIRKQRLPPTSCAVFHCRCFDILSLIFFLPTHSMVNWILWLTRKKIH